MIAQSDHVMTYSLVITTIVFAIAQAPGLQPRPTMHPDAYASYATLLPKVVVSARRFASQEPSTNRMLALRDAVLSRELFKKLPPLAPGTIRAVVYDWDVNGGVATLVTFDDGTTSIYLSTGGGIIGAGKHETVRRAAAAFRNEAARVRGNFTAATTFPLPDDDRSRLSRYRHRHAAVCCLLRCRGSGSAASAPQACRTGTGCLYGSEASFAQVTPVASAGRSQSSSLYRFGFLTYDCG